MSREEANLLGQQDRRLRLHHCSTHIVTHLENAKQVANALIMCYILKCQALLLLIDAMCLVPTLVPPPPPQEVLAPAQLNPHNGYYNDGYAVGDYG